MSKWFGALCHSTPLHRCPACCHTGPHESTDCFFIIRNGPGRRLKDLIEPDLYKQLMEDIELLDELGEELDLEAGA